ncbi:MAG TPA: hypothetical protein VEP30_06390 [Chthoniobacterales bacterium]|nr:hypothetical protein [Chthoniobacterales bacterium]
MAAFVTLILLFSDFVSPKEIMTFVIDKQTMLDGTSARRATSAGTRISIALSADKPKLAKYYVEWAAGLRQLVTKGIPTVEEVRAILRVRLPNLARQWTSNNANRE